MTKRIKKSMVEMEQGITEDDMIFGYVCGDSGGYFFTHYDTLEETLNSIEADSVDGDGGLDEDDVRKFLESELTL